MTAAAIELTLDQARVVFPPLWVVYFHPVEYPLDYVVRVHWGPVQEPNCETFATLAESRAFIRRAGGCVMFARQQGDSISVLESWI